MRRYSLASLLVCLILPLAPVHVPASDGSTLSGEVLYSNADVPLAATLRIPPGAGPFPGVVIVHGSGSSDRSNPWTSAYATALVERGIAVLHPDKRGSGASGGDWRKATFSDLTEDALLALDLLLANPAVDSSRVGLIGFSQGGHIVPLAATRSSAVRFVINVSGSVVPMMEQIGDELRSMGRREGMPESELSVIQSIHEHGVRYALTADGWETYAAALAEAGRGRLGGTEVLAGFPAEPDAPAWGVLRAMGDYDPLPYWRDMEVPALFLYGGRDANVDVSKSVNLIGESLKQEGPGYGLLLFRNNGHALYREDAMDFMARWILDGGVD